MSDEWKRGARKEWCDAYVKICEGRIGEPWIAVALRRMAAGDSEREVMDDYGYRYQPADQARALSAEDYPTNDQMYLAEAETCIKMATLGDTGPIRVLIDYFRRRLTAGPERGET